MTKVYQRGEIVTVSFQDKVSSNTFMVLEDTGETVLLNHPLFPECLIRCDKSKLDTVSPNIKDSIERALDFAKNNANYLDYNTVADLEALCMYFIIRRKLTPRQKNILSTINGTIASIVLNNDIRGAMDMIKENAGILDEFNAMWYRNFSGLFSGKQQITSKKQRSAIFNIAGFVLAELERPVAHNRV
jgi:hypothetical protein